MPALTRRALVPLRNFCLICAYNAAQSAGRIPVSTPPSSARRELRRAAAPTIHPDTAPAPSSPRPSCRRAARRRWAGRHRVLQRHGFPTSITTRHPADGDVRRRAPDEHRRRCQRAFSAVTPARPASSRRSSLTVTTGGSVSASLNASPTGHLHLRERHHASRRTPSPRGNRGRRRARHRVHHAGLRRHRRRLRRRRRRYEPNKATSTSSRVPTTHRHGAEQQQDPRRVRRVHHVVVISDNELICTVNAAQTVDHYAAGTSTYGPAAWRTARTP